MSSFTKQNLSGERVLVQGTDVSGTQGQVVLDGSEWSDVLRRADHNDATENFEAEVEAFFKPLTDAAEKLEQSNTVTVDPMFYEVVSEGSEGAPSEQRLVRQLSHDTVVLRLLDNGHDDRLIWVNGILEILEVLPGTSGVAADGNADSVEPHDLDDVEV